jgi:hypothetical protein
MNSSKKKNFFRYFTEICSLALFMIFSMSLEYLPPNTRDFDPNEKTISFPHTKYEIISAAMLPVRKNLYYFELIDDYIFSYLIWEFQQLYCLVLPL